jgi:Cof subfamily protein (haloacid dehalogenase superfamily)
LAETESLFDLAFCDLDGTICTFDLRVSPTVQRAMDAVIHVGKWITICTGRAYQNLRPFLDRVPANAPLILCNGSLIIEANSWKVIEFIPMPIRLVHSVMRLALLERLQLKLFMDDLETTIEHLPRDSGFVLKQPGKSDREVPNPFELVSRSPHKVAFGAQSPSDSEGIAELVRKNMGSSARVVISSPRIIEVLMPDVSKAAAMARVAALVGVDQRRTLAIGDGDNDVEMIAWAGKGVAMGNATPSALKAADWIAPSVDQDGLAKALEVFMLPPGFNP